MTLFGGIAGPCCGHVGLFTSLAHCGCIIASVTTKWVFFVDIWGSFVAKIKGSFVEIYGSVAEI